MALLSDGGVGGRPVEGRETDLVSGKSRGLRNIFQDKRGISRQKHLVVWSVCRSVGNEARCHGIVGVNDACEISIQTSLAIHHIQPSTSTGDNGVR